MKVLILSLFVVIIDQVSKLMVRLSLPLGIPHPIIGDWFRFTYIENRGMALGIKFGGQSFFIAFSFLAAIVIFLYILRTRNQAVGLRVSLASILGGAIGNLIDRFLYGGVVDFIEVVIGSKRWPIFNLADAAVMVGMVMLIAMIPFDKSERQANNSKEATSQ